MSSQVYGVQQRSDLTDSNLSNLVHERIRAHINEKGLATYLDQGFTIVGVAQRHAKVNGLYIDEVIIERFLDK